MDNSPKRNLLISLIIVSLLGIIAFLGYYAYDLKQQVKKDVAALETKQLQIEKAYAKLDSISKVLDEKIQEITKLGGKVEGLQKIKRQLEREKYELKVAKKIATDRYKKILAKIEEYEAILREKDVEIEKLRVVNEQLSSENQGLKIIKDSLTGQLTVLSGSNESLSQKVKTASVLKTKNIVVAAIAENGKVRNETDYKAKHIHQLQVQVQLEDNKVAEQGQKKIYLKIMDVSGSPLTDASSGRFSYAGQETNYTQTQEILFNNTGQIITFIFKPTDPVTSGKYFVEIYCENYMIGSTTFNVK
ncbi:MAG: hypothetical protein ACOVQA_01450 [Thermoflexibacteraceae bacterium]